jgi:hypothetical protein
MGSHGVELAIRDQTVTGLTMAEPACTDADFTISDSTRIRLADSVPANTRRAYTRQWRDFTDWCATNGGRMPLPATAETFTDYVTHLADTEYAPAGIEQAMGAIRSCHTTAGYESQPRDRAALQVLRQYRRQLAESGQRHQKEAPPSRSRSCAPWSTPAPQTPRSASATGSFWSSAWPSWAVAPS